MRPGPRSSTCGSAAAATSGRARMPPDPGPDAGFSAATGDLAVPALPPAGASGGLMATARPEAHRSPGGGAGAGARGLRRSGTTTPRALRRSAPGARRPGRADCRSPAVRRRDPVASRRCSIRTTSTPPTCRPAWRRRCAGTARSSTCRTAPAPPSPRSTRGRTAWCAQFPVGAVPQHVVPAYDLRDAVGQQRSRQQPDPDRPADRRAGPAGAGRRPVQHVLHAGRRATR